MKRIYVEKGIFIRVNDSGKLSPRCFEATVKTTFKNLPDATSLFKAIHREWDSVYMYDTKKGYLVEFKVCTDNLHDAIDKRNKVNDIVEGWKHERK